MYRNDNEILDAAQTLNDGDGPAVFTADDGEPVEGDGRHSLPLQQPL